MKRLIELGMLLFLTSCGLATGPLSLLDSTPDHIDVSDSESVATIRGATRNVLLAHVICSIRCPAIARKLTVNAGPIDIDAACVVVGEYSESASFSFDAIAGHDYRIRMLVPGSGDIELVDDTNNKIIGVHKQVSCRDTEFCKSSSGGCVLSPSLQAQLSN